MAFPRRLSDHQLIAARWEYEVIGISERSLAAKFGLSRPALKGWITRQAWSRTDQPRTQKGDVEQQPRRHRLAAIKLVSDRKIIRCFGQAVLLLPAAGNLATLKPATCTQPCRPGLSPADGIMELPADRPKQPESKPATGSRRGPELRSPGVFMPLPAARTKPATLPARSRTEAAAMRMRLSALRGELALQQIQQLERHDELLWDYHHLLAVFMNPSRFVDVTGLEPAEAAARCEEVRCMAGKRVLPSKRDTLSGAIATLNKAIIASLAAKRAAAGMTARQIRGRGPQRDEDEREAPRDLSTLDAPSLRSVRTAMALLNGGNAQRHHEPPKPPPPEALDDLQVRRDEILPEA
jgi:hypothetical protein